MRIGVNVPNELLKRAKEIEPRVNISQVCRKALESLVEVAERTHSQTVSDGIADHVTRLFDPAGTPITEPDWVALALDDARWWVSIVTPEDWEYFLENYDGLLDRGVELDSFVDLWSYGEGGRGLHYCLFEHNREWLTSQYKLRNARVRVSNPYEKATQAYVRAWLGYVNEVRRKIDQHYKDEYKRVMAERAAYRQSLPKPEVPSQLI